MKMILNSDFYVLMLIKNYKQLENKQTNKMNVQIIRQTEDRHTDSVGAHSPACVAAGMRRGLHVEWLMDNVLLIWLHSSTS